jgi:hypothetical protein
MFVKPVECFVSFLKKRKEKQSFTTVYFDKTISTFLEKLKKFLKKKVFCFELKMRNVYLCHFCTALQ